MGIRVEQLTGLRQARPRRACLVGRHGFREVRVPSAPTSPSRDRPGGQIDWRNSATAAVITTLSMMSIIESDFELELGEELRRRVAEPDSPGPRRNTSEVAPPLQQSNNPRCWPPNRGVYCPKVSQPLLRPRRGVP